MSNPKQFTWTDPVANIDGSAIAPGEITGYTIGLRLTTAPGSVTGVYPLTQAIPSATAASEAISAMSPALVPGSYAAAIQTNGPVNSAWSAEVSFNIVPPTPNSPTNFTVA